MKSIRVILTILLLATVLGCSRYVDSRDPVRSLPEDGPVPFNLLAQVNSDGSLTLSWEVSGITRVSQFRIYVADSTESNYTLRDSTTESSKTLNGLLINRRYFFKVAAVAKGGPEGDPSEAVSARVSFLSILIDKNDEYANNLNVLIQINAPLQTSHLMLSEDSTFADAIYVPFQGTQTSFTLSDGDGTKAVYARFQFSDGSQSGGLISDDIILDTRARIDSVFFTPSGVTFSAGDIITFGLDAGETDGEAGVSFTGLGEVPLFDDGTNGDPDSRDGIYQGYYVVPNNFNLNNGQVNGSFTDAAGNNAAELSAQEPLNIFSPPLPVTLSAVALSTFEIVLSWTASVSTDFSAYWLYRSTSSSVSNTSDVVTSITDINTTSYTDTDLDDDTTYYYRAYVFDNSGLSSASNVDSATTKINMDPEPVELFAVVTYDTDTDGDTTFTNVSFTWTQSSENDFSSYRLYRNSSVNIDTSDVLIGIETTQSNVTFDYEFPGTPTYYFGVFVFDKHRWATGSNVVEVNP